MATQHALLDELLDKAALRDGEIGREAYKCFRDNS